MSSDLLRRAATVLRERAEDRAEVVEITNGADLTTAYRLGGRYFLDLEGGRRAVEPREGVTVTREFHEQIQPTLGLALADWLDGLADSHGPGGIEELVLHPEEACEVCEDGGHEVEVCAGCYPMWDGMEARQVYPCAEVKRALPLARLIVGDPS